MIDISITMSKPKLNNIRNDERGIVAIFSALILMVVISIIVIGFSQVARREATDALNRQLSTTASYAAESGINDAYSLVNYYQSQSATIPATLSSCTSGPYVQGTSNVLNAATGDTYTCLSINPLPPTIRSSGGSGTSQVYDLTSNSGGFNALDISYTNTGSTAYKPSFCPASPNFTKISNWPSTCPPVLQIDLVPIPTAPTPFSEAQLANSVRTIYLYPINAAPSAPVVMSTIQSGKIYNVGCSPATCDFKLSNMTAWSSGFYPPGVNEYYLKVGRVYNGANITFSGTINCLCATAVQFKNSQAQIDVTGKAGQSTPVLRRTQVSVDIGSTVTSTGNPIPPVPANAIQTDSTLCKRIVVGSGFLQENIPASAPTDYAYTSKLNPASDASAPFFSRQDSCNPFY